MDKETLIRQFPLLFHMAETGTWESIQKHGLLSTSALLDLFGVSGGGRESIESDIRPDSVTVTHPVHGEAVIRDNKPMSRTHLLMQNIRSGGPCLRDGLTPRQWCEILNKRVFFWLSRDRLVRLLSGKAYRDKEHCVLTVESQPLIEAHENDIELSPINSGNTMPYPAPRGRDTFLPVSAYPFEEWKKKRRGGIEPVVELTVRHSVPNIKDYVVKVERMRRDEVLETIWQRSN
jgi:hypothetical protein